MKILLVAILAALVAVTAKRDQIPAYKGIVIVLFILGLLASATQWRSGEEVYDESEDVTVGRMLGEIMAADMPEGGQVLVIDTDFEPGKNPRADAHLDGLKAGWRDTAFEPVRIDPRMLVNYDPDMMSEAPYAVYEGYAEIGPLMKILEQHPDAAAIVSFAGLPYNISPRGIAALPSVYLGKRGVLKTTSDQLIKRDNIRAIVELRPLGAPDPDPSELEGLPEQFRVRYRLLKSES